MPKKMNPACKPTFAREKSTLIHFYFKYRIIFFFLDDQTFLPVNPFAEPTTMSTTNSNNHHHDDDMIDIDFRNATTDKTTSKFILIN